MTRFARAKGSKASNLKDPEDSTPWEVMKEQMMKAKKENEESKKREEAEQQRINNYENFLKERRVEKRKAEWCEFPGTESKKSPVANISKLNLDKKNKKVKSNKSVESDLQSTADNMSKKKKKKKKISEQSPSDLTCSETDNQSNAESNKTDITGQTLTNNKNEINNSTTETIKIKNKNKIKHKTKDQDIPNNTNEKIDSNINGKKRNKKFNATPVRRKEINDKSFKLIINGKDIELVRFDGFPIMKKDAERLQDLKNNMIKKGIPKSEVQRTLKLERRRAEKALARLKRDVCYNCRKGGHNLSDCPDLKSNIPGVGSADGVCFKCGSTEHRQNECKVQRDKEFRFATCFICREPGHLARQCPDNPKGLYPNGGCCKLCGDVTHLRKDCPTVVEKKEGNTIKLSTLDTSDNIEDIGQPTNLKAVSDEAVKKPKKIKF